MNKLFTKVAALTLGVAMAAGVGVALGSANASEAKADYVLAYSFDFETASTGTSSELDATSAVTFLNTAAGSSVVASASNVAKAYSAKGSGGSGVPDKVLKLGSGSSAGSLTFTLASTADEVTKAVLTAYNWPKKAVDITVNSVQRTKASSTAASVDDYVFEFAATREIAMSVPADRAFSITKIELYKTSGTPVTSYSVTDSVENGSVSPSTVSEGATLTATITPDTGYNVPETVSVTMGGVAATHTYENGVVTVQNVTGDVEITGSCVEIPVTPEPAVVETTFADFIAATDADYAKAYHFSATIKAFKSGDTKDKYGNMTLTDGTTDLTVYGSTADATKLVWNGVSAKYEFTNPQDFMTTDLTNDSSVGDTVEVKFVRYFHSSKLNAQGIILSVTPGETPEIPEPEMVTGKKLSDLFADTAGNGKQLYEVTGVVSAWASGKSDATKYGNFYLKETLDSDTEYYIYGATADATKLVWGSASGVYGFSNPQDFLTNKVTKDVVIGSTLTMRLTRCDYNTTLEANGIVVSVVPPAPTAWTDEQAEIFETNLDGYVPPYFAELSGDINVYGNLVQYNVKGDVVDAVNSYYEQQGWKSEVAGYWGHETTGGNGFVEANAQTSATGTIISFQYTEYAVVTLDENGTKTEVKVIPPFEYTLPSPTAELIPAGKEFKAWEIGGDYYEPGDKYNVSVDVTITAVYQDQAPDWSAAEKQALETALHGYLPPYFGELVEDLSTTENGATFTVSGDLSEEFATKLGDGWEPTDTNNYMKVGDNYYLTASIHVFGVRTDLPVGDYSTITFTCNEGEPPAQKFTITYKSGYGTGDDIVISDVEAGSSHTLKTFAETQFVAPAGQQFKGWRVGSETTLHDAGYEITNIQADINIFANYEDIPVTDWSDAFKAEYTSRFGSTYLPPFVSAEFADENAMYWFDGYPIGYVSVEGNLLSVAISAFNGQWAFVGDAQNAIYIFCDANMNAFVQILYDQDYGTTDLVFAAIGNLALDTTGVKTEYFVGDAVDTTNLTVHPMLYNGTVVPGLQLPSTMWSVSPSTFTEAGAQQVTVTVPDFFTEPVELPYDVNVTAVLAESISVSGQATKTSYSVGEEWSAEGLVVTAHYNNGTEADVTDQVTWSFDPAETAVEVTSVSAVAHLGDLSSDAVVFDVIVEQNYDSDAFAKDLLELVAPICANYDGKKNNKVALKTVWDTMSQRYSTLSDEEKAKVIAAAAKTDGTDLEKAMAFYNYACKKYGLTKFIEGRQVKALVTEHETGNSILPIVVIVASSVAAITAIGVVIALKRRKALLAK